MVKQKTITKKVVVLLVAVTMILTVGLMAACNITDTLQTNLDALQTEVVSLYENGGATEAQLDKKQERIDAFRNGSKGTLTPAQKQQLDEVQGKVDDMRNGENEMLLSNEIASRINQDAWNAFFITEYPNATIRDVFIEQYFGTFGGSVVVMVWLRGIYPAREAVDISIAGYEFTFNSNKQIRVWRDGKFYDLQEAFEAGYIVDENITQIHRIWEQI